MTLIDRTLHSNSTAMGTLFIMFIGQLLVLAPSHFMTSHAIWKYTRLQVDNQKHETEREYDQNLIEAIQDIDEGILILD